MIYSKINNIYNNGDKMKLLIAGSRQIKNFDISLYIPEDVDTILSGGAKGIDSLAEEFADKNRLSKIILRPRYDLYGKAAPLKRNEVLINMADKVLVFWDGKSRGTKYTINYAKKINKDVTVILV